MIEIFREVAQNKGDAVLVIVGDGALRRQMEECVDLLGMDEQVIFLGKRNDISKLYSAMDIFVLPSFYEGLSVVLVETQANGLATVCSDSIPRINLTGRASFLSLDAKNSIWAEHIINCSYERNTDVTRLIVEGGYDITCETRKLEDFYAQAVASTQN